MADGDASFPPQCSLPSAARSLGSSSCGKRRRYHCSACRTVTCRRISLARFNTFTMSRRRSRSSTTSGRLRYQELGGDTFHFSGLPEALISATTTLYSAGRDLARDLAVDLRNVTNPARFLDVSHVIRYFEERIAPRTTELEAVVADCDNELAAIPAVFDFDALFAQQQARFGMGPSPLGISRPPSARWSVFSASNLRSSTRSPPMSPC